MNAIVDKDEYNETKKNIKFIKADSQRYIDDYVNFIKKKPTKYDTKEFDRKYKYSTLKYFHRQLGILEVSNINVDKS